MSPLNAIAARLLPVLSLAKTDISSCTDACDHVLPPNNIDNLNNYIKPYTNLM